MTSEAGQNVLESGESFEYPLKSGVAANPKLPPLSSYQPNSFSPADLGTGDLANYRRLFASAAPRLWPMTA